MRIWFVSRGSHEEVVGLLTAQIEELRQERQRLLDRLVPPVPAPEAAEEDAEASASELEQLLRLRRRPSQLAEALTRKAHRDHYRRPAPVSAVTVALDQAEAAGKI